MISFRDKYAKYKNVSWVFPAIAAFLWNFCVMILKWIAFFVSGSSSMFSEAIHSVADTANQFLLVVGIRRSRRWPTEEYTYWFGQERFFWGLVSACGIFFLWAGVTLYHGIESLIRMKTSVHNDFVYYVLISSFIIEGFTLYLAYRELKKHHPKKDLAQILKQADPVTLAVFYEDSVAVTWVAIAALSIFLTKITGLFYFDAIGSILIGCMLAVVAFLLINKNREVLISKAIGEDRKELILDILDNDPAVEHVLDFKSSMLDIGTYRIKCEIEFNGNSLLREMYRRDKDFLKDEYEYIQKDYQEFLKFCADYTDRIPRMLWEHINGLEKKIQEAVPEAKYIDIEIN